MPPRLGGFAPPSAKPEFKRFIVEVDTTVHEKAIAHPVDICFLEIAPSYQPTDRLLNFAPMVTRYICKSNFKFKLYFVAAWWRIYWRHFTTSSIV